MEKNIDRNSVLNDFTEELNSLKEQIKLKHQNKQNNQINYENYIIFLNTLKSSLSNDQQKKYINGIITKMKEKTIESEDVDNLKEFLKKLEIKNITKGYKEKLVEQLKVIKETQKQLKKIKEKIKKVTNKEKKKLQAFKEKFEVLSTKHPIWTRAMLSLLPSNLQNILMGKEETNSNNWIYKIKGVFYKILGMLLVPFFMFFAPKEIKKFFKEIKTLLGDGILEKVGKLPEISKEIKEKLEKIKPIVLEVFEEKMQKVLGIADKEKLKKVLDKWWRNISSDVKIRENLVKNFGQNLEDLKNGLLQKNIPDLFLVLGIGFKGVIDLLNLLIENKLISPKQIGARMINKGVDMAKGTVEITIHSIGFLPNFTQVVLGKIPIEKLYDINIDNLTPTQKNLFLVMLYRTINTRPFSLLQHIAALPLHALSSVVNADTTVKKVKTFTEVLGGGFEKQLDWLVELEKKLTNKKGLFLTEIKEAFQYYKESIIVSYAYNQAGEDVGKFKKILESTDEFKKIFKNTDEFKKFLEKVDELEGAKSLKYFVATLIEGNVSKIKNLKINHSEDLKKTFKYFFSDEGKLFKTTMDNFADILRTNSEILKSRKIVGFLNKWIKKVSLSTKIAEGLDEIGTAIHFTGTLDDFKAFTDELKLLARESPEVVKILFRSAPVIILSADIIKAIKEGKNIGKEILKVYMSFVPLVGPIMFLSDGYNNESIKQMGIAGFFVGLDLIWIVKSIKSGGWREVMKLGIMPITDTARALKEMGFAMKRGKKMLEYLWNVASENKGKASVVVTTVALIITTLIIYKQSTAETDQEIKNFINNLSEIAKEKGQAGLNNYIISNWNNFKSNEKKAILAATIGKYLGLTSEMLVKYIDDVKIEDKKVVLDLTSEGSKSEYVKNKIQEEGSFIGDLVRKVGYEKFTVNYYS